MVRVAEVERNHWRGVVAATLDSVYRGEATQ
jgi:hypothetical protein